MKPTAVAIAAIADRLAAATGMDPRALDASRLNWIVEARCRHLQLADAAAYARHLQATAAELEILIEDVVIQETRFFRDPAVFDHLRDTLTRLAAAFPGPLRLLSAPCGTGQEPYSLAAAAEQVGLLDRITIDALDISHTALTTARRASYPAQAFTALNPELQKLLAAAKGRQWHIHPALRDRIRFDHRNLADPAALPLDPTYHLILCRNLFIYLHPAARTALARSLSQSLLPGGRLILGSADNVEEITTLFAPIRPAASFAFTHRTAKSTARQTPKLTEKQRPTRTQSPAQSAKAATQTSQSRTLKAVAAEPARTEGATQSLHLKPTGTKVDPAALYKQALQQQHLGNLTKSERLCRQALYLNPTDLAAMELLQTLWRQQPNQRLRHALTARILRTRSAKESA